MFFEYLEKLRMSGRMYFTFDGIVQELQISENAARSGIYRLKKQKKLISPLKGLYIIVPPEHRPHGSIPAEAVVPIIMNHLNAEYYVALLSAAAFYGAAHQKIFKFQIITNTRITHPLEFGQIKIEAIRKKSLLGMPTKNFAVSTGYLKVATPELVAIDLLNYPHRAGGLNHIATVLSELVENIDVNKLIALAQFMNCEYQLQRLGYILEKIDVMDDDQKSKVVDQLVQFLEGKMQRYFPLTSEIAKTGYSRCKKWKIIENTNIEADI